MKKCPNCKKPSSEEYRPFCCKRCADVDLGNWLSDRYVVPGKEIEKADIQERYLDDEDEDKLTE